jgi:hypothetical protein
MMTFDYSENHSTTLIENIIKNGSPLAASSSTSQSDLSSL